MMFFLQMSNLVCYAGRLQQVCCSDYCPFMFNHSLVPVWGQLVFLIKARHSRLHSSQALTFTKTMFINPQASRRPPHPLKYLPSYNDCQISPKMTGRKRVLGKEGGHARN